jgi:hypothetical protein
MYRNPISFSKALRRLITSIGIVLVLIMVTPMSYFAFIFLVKQNRYLALFLGSYDVNLPINDLGIIVTLRVASASPLGAGEYHRSLLVRLANKHTFNFPLSEDWGGIKALSIYSTGTHLRVLDCVTGFDIDTRTGEQIKLKDGYTEDAVIHLGSFVKGRGIELTQREPMPLKMISMSC